MDSNVNKAVSRSGMFLGVSSQSVLNMLNRMKVRVIVYLSNMIKHVIE